MGFKSRNFFLSILSIVGVSPRGAYADRGMPITSVGHMKNELTDQLIRKNMFLVDPISHEIILDEDKLLSTLRDELNNKILDKKELSSNVEIYKHLIHNLKPGNFGRVTNGSPELSSMDFNKEQ